MSTLTIDEKLSLIQKMRAHANVNQNQIYTRVQPQIHPGTVAGNVSVNQSLYRSESTLTGDAVLEQELPVGTFKLRLLVCVLAFSAFVGLYKMNVQIKGHKVTEVNSLLEENQLPKNAQESLETAADRLVEQVSRAK